MVEQLTIPQVGMLATVRNRRAIISSVEPCDGGAEGRFHLVQLEYTDPDGPREEQIIWEHEMQTKCLEPSALPRVDSTNPMAENDFNALVRSTRWTAFTPYVSPNNPQKIDERFHMASPFFGAIQVDDFQLVPLYHALEMPRISLLLADDVGLGKTIEAGMVLTELLIRRRIRRILILCPASLRTQWRDEMRDKFSLHFDIVDRTRTHLLQKRQGLDINPWRSFPRIIASYHYLRQHDILGQFLAASRYQSGSPHLPWDLLIVDEVHNLAPSQFGDDSDLSKMLHQISPLFEHKIFLTATPHNGYTRCFSGLLEMLDPVRFTRTSEFTDDERNRVEQVVIRRLKSEINAATDPARFCTRDLMPRHLSFSPKELTLSKQFQDFRTKVKELIAELRRKEELIGSFAIEILNKRLLSGPYTFAESWNRYLEGMYQSEEADTDELHAAKRAAEEDLDDDLEAEGRRSHAVRTVGAWLQPLADKLEQEMKALNDALAALDLPAGNETIEIPDPKHDARREALMAIIKEYMMDGNRLRDDERLVIFTEYKTTLDYLERRLRREFPEDGAVRVLYGGGMTDEDRDDLKRAFNDPDDPVRILVATDAASEGLNLQETARFILHWDVPWNPARLEQRNGRLDRHGQARDVTVFHFTSDDDADLSFLAHVVAKVDQIREDLGSMQDVFNAAFMERFLDLQDASAVQDRLDKSINYQRGRVEIPRNTDEVTGEKYMDMLTEFSREIDLSPESLQQVMEIALGIGVGHPRLDGPDENGRYKLNFPIPPRWQMLIDEELRIQSGKQRTGQLPGIVFDPAQFIQTINGRHIFRPRKDTRILHLGHVLFHHALNMLARYRFPGTEEASRWAVRYGDVPEGADALVLLTVEELALNELREPFHHWTRTFRQHLRHRPLAGDRGRPQGVHP